MTFKEFFRLCEFATELNVPLATVIPGNTPFGAVPSDTGPSPSQDPAPIPPNRGEQKLGIPEIPITGIVQSITGPGQQQHGRSEQDGRNTVQVTINNSDPNKPGDQKATHLFLTWDEWQRKHLIKGGEMKVGSTVTVVFQRHPSDKSRLPSQIQSITVH